MIFGKNAGLMLKYQKAKAKMVEYDVSKQEYPHFPLNSNELSYPTTYVLSRYSECIIENNHDELKELESLLITTAEYYDSAFKSKDRPEYDWDFLLSGASAYFLRKDFGSAKVLTARVVDLIDEERSPQKLLTNLYNYLLGGVYLPYLRVIDTYERINNFFLDYFGKGKSLEALKSNLWVYRNEIYENGDPDSIFYVDILVAVIIVACENSSWSLLPSSSGIPDEEWEPYLQSKMSIKMLWPAQRLIAEKGLLRGESSIVQLPTGVGKTRSIELIIRAAFLSERANIAIIVAPLRALCNEITMDMYKAFGNDVTINQFSDVLQNDFWNLFSEDIKRQILICTPEKLSYVLHHDPFFLNIENYLCLVRSAETLVNDSKKSAVDICTNTLAYAMATEKEKELLIKVFQKIEENIQQYSVEKLSRYSNTMSGIGLSSLIEEWIVQNELTEKIYTETELLSVIAELYLQICGDFRYQEHIQSICKKWIDGQTPTEINNKETIGIAEVESLCNKRISYEMNFLIGNICDLIEVDGENEEQVDQRNILTLLQKKVKYGVPNMTAISICESIFNDRLLAIELAQILSDANIGTDKILNMLKSHSEEIFSCLDSYPEYFKDRLSVLMK